MSLLLPPPSDPKLRDALRRLGVSQAAIDLGLVGDNQVREAHALIESERAQGIEPDLLYGIAELRVLLNPGGKPVSERSVYNAFEAGLRYSMPAGKRVVLGSDLIAYVKAQRVR